MRPASIRKCRFIFGGGILVLVTFSFYWYGQKTETLVIAQTKLRAQSLVKPEFDNLHHKMLGNKDYSAVIENFTGEHSLSPLAGDRVPKPRFIKPEFLRPGTATDLDGIELEVLARFLRSASVEEGHRKTGTPRPRLDTFADGTSMSEYRKVSSKSEYKYLQAIIFKPSCLLPCHSESGTEAASIDDHMMRPGPNGKWVQVKSGDLAGMAVVSLPMGPISEDINLNRAILDRHGAGDGDPRDDRLVRDCPLCDREAGEWPNNASLIAMKMTMPPPTRLRKSRRLLANKSS